MTRLTLTPVLLTVALLGAAPAASPQDARQAALASLDARQTTYARISQQIWDWAEVGYQETRSSALLQDELRRSGFTVQAGVAGMPTAFVASYGRGTPVIALLAEFDALPGITQDRVPERRPIVDKPSGHACGHHLFGTGSMAAAIAVREWIEKTGTSGTVRVYGTTVDHEVIHGLYALLPNDALARVVDRHLRAVGGVTYDAGERAFAEAIRATFEPGAPPIERAAEIDRFEMKDAGGSTDVADVSWVVPTAGLRAATWVPGTASHSWQAIAAGGMSIGIKGMTNAARVLALTAIDLLSNPTLIAEAGSEFRTRVGPDFVYRPLVGSRQPPLDYRK